MCRLFGALISKAGIPVPTEITQKVLTAAQVHISVSLYNYVHDDYNADETPTVAAPPSGRGFVSGIQAACPTRKNRFMPACEYLFKVTINIRDI